MKIVIAPDSFKGSISSRSLCAALAQAVHAVYPEAEVRQFPLADGGEGTVECLLTAVGGELRAERVTGPSGETVEACYAVLPDGTAVIEAAQASGLTLTPPAERNPLHATSRGTGELIVKAMEAGCRSFVIGLGGSGTNDGGAGMLRALGLEFLDGGGRPLPEGGAALLELERIDASAVHPLLRESRFTAACDVQHVLCGPQGASAVFGPQKGATPAMVDILDRALRRYAEIAHRQQGMRMLDWPGGGAAGGLGAACMAFLNAAYQSGIETYLALAGWEAAAADASLIITGEGRLDEQTLAGKAIMGVCRSAARWQVPVIALAGSVELTEAQLEQLGVACAFSIVPGPGTLEQAMANAEAWAGRQMRQALRALRLGERLR